MVPLRIAARDSTGDSVHKTQVLPFADPESGGMLDVSGFAADAPQLITDFAAARLAGRRGDTPRQRTVFGVKHLCRFRRLFLPVHHRGGKRPLFDAPLPLHQPSYATQRITVE